MNVETIFQIGDRPHWGGESAFGFSLSQLQHHCYVIGKTGSGKTTLLRNLILQLAEAGHGVGLIDPHGDLAEELIEQLSPKRAEHTTYFCPADAEFPIGLNLLAQADSVDRHLVASGVVGAFKNLWSESWGPRMEYILHNAVASLAACPNTSLLGVNRLLTDAGYRRWIVDQLDDAFLRDFWEGEYESYDARFRREAIAPIQNKIGQLLLSPLLRNIVGQVANKARIPFLMDQGRLFIANLSKGRLGHDKANLIGSLLVTQFQLAAMARSRQPESDRRDFFLFVDEFQNFATEAFTSILAEARKYRLNLVLSHQYIAQLTPAVREAVFGNVGTVIAFGVGFNDAEHLHREFGKEFTSQQFVDLPRYETLIRVHGGGSGAHYQRAVTMPALAPNRGRRDRLIRRSRERFATPRLTVEARLNRWLARRF
ncbi:MAG: type IV secretory system conjugative DNA transfer family protein [Verrucomicrobiales bacterium]